jgi:methylenetetrahydrofolate dehydrogenase (NADP+)/methenyltetrahydrofolate cyclohydrolase
MSTRLAGKPVTDALKARTLTLAGECQAKGMKPALRIIRVGERPDDLYYEGGLIKTCAATGIDCTVTALPTNVNQSELEKTIIEAGADKTIHGILMFCPLPKNLDEAAARALIPLHKDVDCLTLAGAAAVFADREEGFPPCTPAAVMELLKFYEIPLKGRRITVIGRSLVVGKPLAMLLLREHATVTIAHSRTQDLPAVAREADILIAAVGRAKMVGSDYINPDQIIIDVGINDDPDETGKMCGDVDYAACEEHCAAITPVPGGIGGITSAVLCWHTARACANIL